MTPSRGNLGAGSRAGASDPPVEPIDDPSGPKGSALPSQLSTTPDIRSPLAPGSSASLTRRPERAVGFKLRVSGIEVALRLARLVAGAALRHGLGRLGDGLRPPAARADARRARTERTVGQAVAEMGQLKGAFVKVGQFALVRHDLLPQAAAAALATLRSHVPPLPFEIVRRTVEQELGGALETAFVEFAETPLGAASVAQVHWARLADGTEVAVKVQYPWVERSLPSDLAWIRRLARGVARWLGREIPDEDRLFHEFEEGLREELDFEREARIATEIAANLAHEPQVAVPEIIASHSTRRVLTMRYLPAVPIDDHAALARIGASPGAVVEVLGRAYAKQIFVDGLFHADPHPGNLFVIDEPEAQSRPRILFVDFGLSRRLSAPLRKHLRVGIYALLRSDLDAFVAEIDAMGMVAPGAHASVRAAVDAMFARIRSQGGGLGVPGHAILGLKDEAVALLRETPGLQLPNDLLLYARTLSYLFQLGQTLDPEVDLMKISTPHLLKFLATSD